MKLFIQASNKVKFIEIIVLFVVIPIVLLLSISITFKVIFVGLGVVYISLISIFKEKFSKVKTDKNQTKKQS